MKRTGVIIIPAKFHLKFFVFNNLTLGDDVFVVHWCLFFVAILKYSAKANAALGITANVDDLCCFISANQYTDGNQTTH